MLQSVIEYYRVLQSIAKYYRVLQNIIEYYRVFLAHLLRPISGLRDKIKKNSSFSSWSRSLVQMKFERDFKQLLPRLMNLILREATSSQRERFGNKSDQIS